MTRKDLWFSRKLVLYGRGDKLWVPLIGLWGVISYTSLLVLRQYRSKQFILATHELNNVEFDYRGSGYANYLIVVVEVMEGASMDGSRKTCL